MALIMASDVKIEAVVASARFGRRRNIYNAFRRITGYTPSELAVKAD